MKAAAVLLLALATAFPAPPQLGTAPDIRVEATIDQDEIRCSIRCESAPLDRLLEKLAAEIGYDVEGLDLARRPTLVTAELVDRPLDRALEYVLGSVGMTYQLRRGTITVVSHDTSELDAHALLDLASASYVKAVTRHPNHPLAPGARLDQGKVAELRGFPGAALDHYQSLIEAYPNSPSVPEAYMRSGVLLSSLGRWADAAGQYRTLANLELAEEFTERARRELARCTVELGDPQGAYYILVSLDKTHPVHRGPDRDKRELVRALALVGLERHLEALRALEVAEPGLTGADRTEALRVRALALQGAGHPGDAGRAWLLYASEIGDPQRGNALEHAAKLALEAGDEVGALFVCRQAEGYGLGARMMRYRDEAYERLGFATEPTPEEGVSARERIAQAETALEEGDAGDATRLVEGLLPGAGALDEELRLRLAIAWAKCLRDRDGLEAALGHLREVRTRYAGDDRLEARASLDVTAADMLEDEELYDRAADAYRGVY